MRFEPEVLSILAIFDAQVIAGQETSNLASMARTISGDWNASVTFFTTG